MIGHFECTLNAGLNCKYIRSTSDFLRLHNRHRRNFIIIIRCWLCFAIAPADTFMCGRQNVFQLKSSWPFYLSLLFYIFFSISISFQRLFVCLNIALALVFPPPAASSGFVRLHQTVGWHFAFFMNDFSMHTAHSKRIYLYTCTRCTAAQLHTQHT